MGRVEVAVGLAGLVTVQFACVWIAVQEARRKQRDPELWGALAIVLGVVAVAWVAVLRPLPPPVVARRRPVPELDISRTFADGHLPQWRGRR